MTRQGDMIRIEEMVHIERAPHDVWSYVTDPDKDTVWMSNVIEYEAEWETEPRPGDATRRVAKVAGRRCEFTTEITDVVPDQLLGWKSVESPFPFQNGLRLEATDNGTRVTFFGITSGMRGFFGRLADPLVARMFSRDMHSNLQRLKQLLEEQSRSPDSHRHEHRDI